MSKKSINQITNIKIGQQENVKRPIKCFPFNILCAL